MTQHNRMKSIRFVFRYLIQPAGAAQWLVKETLIPPSGVVADPDGILSDTQKKQRLDKLQLLDITLRAVDDENKESKENKDKNKERNAKLGKCWQYNY